MFRKLPILALTGLALLQGVSTQTTTMNIFPGQPSLVENLQGEIQGTGADGTTFVVSGIISGIPATATIVEAATYLSEHIVVSTSGVKVQFDLACGLDSQNTGLCTAVVNGGGGGIETGRTVVESATVSYAPVAIDISPNDNGASALPLATSIFALAPLLGFAVALW